MRCLVVTVFAAALLAGCGDSTQKQSVAKTPVNQSTDTASSRRLENVPTKHLPNAVRVHAKVISGGQPDGDAGFEELKSLGIKTVISVDGATPNIAAASKYGLKYVHLPHGYDGVPDTRVKELAKAVRDLDGSIYIHCHHGKHRSPAAASVACVAAGLIPAADALAVLQLAGTSPTYRGLYQSASKAHPLDKALLDELKVEFREKFDLPPMAVAMVALEHTHDHIKQIAAAGWRSPPSHPDLEPAHEALLLREHFIELLRAPETAKRPAEFQQMLQDAETAAKALEDALEAWQSDGYRDPAPAALKPTFDRVTANCKVCHEKFRDVPLDEKTEMRFD